jgi:hypothetical protein
LAQEKTETRQLEFMWNKATLFLWISVSVKKEGKRGFSIKLFLPLFLLLQWIDIAEDLLVFLRLFSWGRRMLSKIQNRCNGLSLKYGVTMAKAFVQELILHTGRTDLVDVDVEDKGSHVTVKCFLR